MSINWICFESKK